MGCFKRTASKHVQYLGWNRPPAQVGCMRQALGPGALGKPRGSGWRGRWEEGSGWGTHVNPWLFHSNVWQNSLQKKNLKKKRNRNLLCIYCKYNINAKKKKDGNLTVSVLTTKPKNKAKATQGSFQGWWMCLWPRLWWWYHQCLKMSKFIKFYTLNMCNFCVLVMPQ